MSQSSGSESSLQYIGTDYFRPGNTIQWGRKGFHWRDGASILFGGDSLVGGRVEVVFPPSLHPWGSLEAVFTQQAHARFKNLLI